MRSRYIKSIPFPFAHSFRIMNSFYSLDPIQLFKWNISQEWTLCFCTSGTSWPDRCCRSLGRRWIPRTPLIMPWTFLRWRFGSSRRSFSIAVNFSCLSEESHTWRRQLRHNRTFDSCYNSSCDITTIRHAAAWRFSYFLVWKRCNAALNWPVPVLFYIDLWSSSGRDRQQS